MKILLVLTLITGLVGCFDVIGYQGGSVTIFCEGPQYGRSEKYFCKEKTEQCICGATEIHQLWIHQDRVSLVAYPTYLTVVYRDLRLEDAGSYQCGETGVWSHTVNLKVNQDPCCSGLKAVIGYLGESVTLYCSYPEEFQNAHKYFYKLNGHTFKLVITTTDPEKDRFSISEDRRSGVVNIRVRDVREDDGGDYYCGVGKGGKSVSFDTFFTKTHLQVSDSKKRQSTTIQPTTVNPSKEELSSSSLIFIIIIITVSICVVLVLIGGLTLIFYKLRLTRTEGSTSPLNTPAMRNMNTVQLSPDSSVLEGPEYTTVTYQKNSGSPTNARVIDSTEEPDTEYSTICHYSEVK